MEYLPLLGTITIVHLLGVISPGPDFIMTIRNSLSYSRKTGIFTSIGMSIGIAVHLTYCIAGLALIISQSILFFNALKLLGAAYLIYIGIKSIFSKSSKTDIKTVEVKSDISPLQAVKIGFLTNVLNPKATLFFLSLFTFVISPNTPPLILLIGSIIMIVDTFLWFSLVAIFFTHEKIRNAFKKFESVFNKLLGGILIAVGVKVALSHR